MLVMPHAVTAGASLYIEQENPRGPTLADRAYEISKSFKLAKDFEISPRFQDFAKDFRDFRISPKISGFRQRFQGFRKDFRDFKISRKTSQNFKCF